MADPTSYLVNIALSQLNMETGIWERLLTLAGNEENDGQAVVMLPFGNETRSEDDIAEFSNDTRPVSIEVVVATEPLFSEALSRVRRQEDSEPFLLRFVRRWSPVTYFGVVINSIALRTACEVWCRLQQETGEEILERLPPCPRTVAQARAPNSGFTEDRGVARFLSQNFVHRGAESCFRQTTFTA